MNIFTLLVAFILNFNMQDVSAKTEGQYYEVVAVEYDQKADETYGVFVRYNVDNKGHAQKQHLQIRPTDGKATEKQLMEKAPADAYITKIVD